VCLCFDQWFSTAAPRGLSSVPQAFQQNGYALKDKVITKVRYHYPQLVEA